MNEEIKEYINKIAGIVKKHYKKAKAGSLEEFVRMLGGDVKEDSGIGLTADGSINKQAGTDKFTIQLVPGMTKERKRFIIAHELGHLFLHLDFGRDSEKWINTCYVGYFEGEDQEKEQQANEFAEVFLMPQEEYITILEKCTDKEIVNMDRVAQHFNVTRNIAEHRGRSLGYLRWDA